MQPSCEEDEKRAEITTGISIRPGFLRKCMEFSSPVLFVLVPESEGDLCTCISLNLNLSSQLVFGQKVDESQAKALDLTDIESLRKSYPVITDFQALIFTVVFHSDADDAGF